MALATIKQTSEGYSISFMSDIWFVGTDYDQAVRECEAAQQEYDLEQEIRDQETAEWESLGADY